MTLPKREYFYLPEITQMLNITEYDLNYYLSHGEILALIWVKKTDYVQEYFDATKMAYISYKGLCSHEGYLALHWHDCREVIDKGSAPIRSFLFHDQMTRMIIPVGQPEIHVKKNSLMVSVWDIMFFSQKCHFAKVPQKLGGRPSIMPSIIEEHMRRRTSGKDYKNRTREAQALHDWACVHHQNDTPPSRDSIRNALIAYDKERKITV